MQAQYDLETAAVKLAKGGIDTDRNVRCGCDRRPARHSRFGHTRVTCPILRPGLGAPLP